MIPRQLFRKKRFPLQRKSSSALSLSLSHKYSFSSSFHSSFFSSLSLSSSLFSSRSLSSISTSASKPLRKKTKTIRQVELEAERETKLLGHYDLEHSFDNDFLIRKKVRAVCTADSYDLKGLYASVAIEYPNCCQLFANEVLRISINGKECFFFDMGTLVAWDMESQDFDELRDKYKSFEIGSVTEKEFDEIDYTDEERTELSSLSDKYEPILIIGGKQSIQNIYLDKLAFSHGVANSVKLAVLENQVDVYVESIKHLPMILINQQLIPLTRTQSLSKLGELLQFRAVLNLHSGLIETPDLYWNYSTLEDHFYSISNEFDIKQRVDALNKKLDYAGDIAELLKGYLSERHSLRLEWCIIILIAAEVGFELIHFMV